MTAAGGSLLAISDLHVGSARNRALVETLYPQSPNDWLIVAGDVAERSVDVLTALGILSERFAQVIWTPGNHELWTLPGDADSSRGEDRYRKLVDLCRSLGVVTPEDPYLVWDGPDGPVTVVPLFLLYDYSFLPDGAATKDQALALAYRAGIVCTDEFLLHPDPYASRDTWCEARVKETERRLTELPGGTRTVLVNHYPLVREPTATLRRPEFAQWCGTTQTAEWHVRFGAVAVVYGHLHIRRTTWHDGVPFVEASLGYPAEWGRRAKPAAATAPRHVLPTMEAVR